MLVYRKVYKLSGYLYRPVNMGLIDSARWYHLIKQIDPTDKPEDIPLASHVRKMVTVFLFDEFDERRFSDGTVHPAKES